MKNIQKITCFLLLCITNAVFSQEESSKNVSISEVQLFSGLNYYSIDNISLNEISNFAPNSAILSKDYSGFNNNNNTNYGTYLDQSLSAMLGISFKNKPKTLLRIGLNYQNKTNLYSHYYREDTYTYDTLTSSQTGQQYFLDSTTLKYLYMYQGSQQVHFDASFIFSTDPTARWSLYGGVGVLIGISFNSYTALSYGEAYSSNEYSNSNYYSSDNSLFERFHNKNYMSSSVYLPFGVDFRIGTKRPFWNRLHLFYEARPMLSFSSIPEWKQVVNMNLTQGIGVKIKW